MAQVLRNKLTDMVREMTANKRAGDPGALSLDAPLNGTEDGITLGDVLADGQADPAASGDMDSRHARIDLTRAMAFLTPNQQRLCQLLGEEGLSIKEAAERLRIPRGTLYEEIKRVRQIFDQQGLGDYLKDCPGNFPRDSVCLITVLIRQGIDDHLHHREYQGGCRQDDAHRQTGRTAG